MSWPDPAPLEPEPPISGNGPLARHDQFHPTALSPAGMAFLHQSLARQARRRRAYRGGLLRVCIEGAERWTVDARMGPSAPFHMPLGASTLEVLGDDADGALLLAVFPLPEPDGATGAGTQHLSVTLEGGQTVALDIALAKGREGEAPASVIRLAYADPSGGETAGTLASAVKALLPTPRPGAIYDGGAGQTHHPPVP
jgi:hypothetical protein